MIIQITIQIRLIRNFKKTQNYDKHTYEIYTSVHLHDLALLRCFTAGQRRPQSAAARHPASLHQLARLRGAVLAHRHAEIPQEGQDR